RRGFDAVKVASEMGFERRFRDVRDASGLHSTPERSRHRSKTTLRAMTGDSLPFPSYSELQITLAPLSSPHRTHAAQALGEKPDQTATTFPGSRLRIRFAVHPPPRIGLAFPGSPGERSTAAAVVTAP